MQNYADQQAYSVMPVMAITTTSNYDADGYWIYMFIYESGPNPSGAGAAVNSIYFASSRSGNDWQ